MIKCIHFLLFVCLSSMLFGQQSMDLLLKIDPDWSDRDIEEHLAEALPENEFEVHTIVADLNLMRVELEEFKTRERVYAILEDHPAVYSLALDYPLEYRDTEPNDPLYGEQYHLPLLEFPRIWDETQGGNTALGERICVAIIEREIQIDHPDIQSNIWINNGEIPGDNVDNDNNGYVDDYRGPNIQTGLGDHPIGSHGTSVMGILAAEGDNGLGMSGVNWDLDVMLVSNARFTSDLVEALEYIRQQRILYNQSDGQLGAFVVATNLSGGFSGLFPEDAPMICEMYDLLGQEGILSVGSAPNGTVDIDESGDLPALCSSPYLMIVSGSTQNNQSANRGYGPSSVDLYAPSEGVPTTSVGDGYSEFSGTSGSAPIVAGTIALLHASPCPGLAEAYRNNPSNTALDIKEMIYTTVTPVMGMSDPTVTDGIIQPYEAFLKTFESCGPGETGLSITELGGTDPNTIDLRLTTEDESDHQLLLFDVLGRTLYSQTLREIPENFIDISIPRNTQMPSGTIYFVSWSSDKKEKVLRISQIN